MYTNTPLSRRDFLKIGLLALGSLAAGPGGFIPPLPDGEKLPVGMARVATAEVALYQEPDLRSKRIGRLLRDQVIDLWEVVRSPAGPSRNPVWYRLDEGWVHSALLQRVDQQHLNPVASRLESELVPAEITVPLSQSMRIDRNGNWNPVYRLYYQSLHWVAGIRPGPDGAPWYELKDERLLVKYCVPAEHVRLLKMEEYMPLSVGLPLDAKLIEVYIGEQMLRAYEEGKLVREVRISSGLPQFGESPNGILTDTPIGSFYVTSKWPVRHMGYGYLTSDPDAYELPGVPWNMFFHESGYALHGAYWHNNFGSRMSHGCVNIPPSESQWLFRWTDPIYIPGKIYTLGHGTTVNVYE